MNTSKLLLATLLCGILVPAIAFDMQDGAPPAAPGPQMRLDGAERLPLPLTKTVKNAPYSAEAISERTQTLADGNQIVNKQSTMSYRDSAGRTRQEIQNAKGEVNTIRLHDPVEGVAYVLNVRQKTASKITRPERGALLAAARERIAQLRKDGQGPRALEVKDESVVKRVERLEENITVRTAPNNVTMVDPDGRIKMMLSGALGDMRWARKATVSDLGTKDIEGIKAQGKLRSYEIPAGEVGNRNPIVVTQENWYAPDLQITVYSKHSDPRSGEKIYRLSGLKREEPAAALFAVPPDYTVK